MAWIGFDLDDTLVSKQPILPEEGMEESDPQAEPDIQDMPTDGAIEAVMRLAQEGHRLTVFTARFKAMPDSEKQRIKEQIEQELQQMGFPPLEVWTGTVKPDLDIYIGNEAVTFDGDWPLVLAQVYHMMGELGLMPPPQEGQPMGGEETAEEQPRPQQEEA